MTSSATPLRGDQLAVRVAVLAGKTPLRPQCNNSASKTEELQSQCDSSEVAEPYFNLKRKGDCACGCGIYGTPKGKLGHIPGCTCKQCSSGRNSKDGKRSQVPVARKLGAKNTSTLHPGNEETLATLIRFEQKKGVKAKTVETFFDNCAEQSDAAKSIGDNRPFTAIAVREQREFMVIEITNPDTLKEIGYRLGLIYGFVGGETA